MVSGNQNPLKVVYRIISLDVFSSSGLSYMRSETDALNIIQIRVNRIRDKSRANWATRGALVVQQAAATARPLNGMIWHK